MSGITRSQAIASFLNKFAVPDLAALYTPEMEVQVNVAQDGGERVDKSFAGANYHEFTDHVQSWKSFRMPLHSMLVPEDNDHEIKFDLALHVESIGLTGWNWVKKRSMHVAFDFDALVGHSEKHQKKLTPTELDDVRRRVTAVDWVTLRRSTSGSGLHLYVFLDTAEVINNHSEHMALGRAVLSQLSAVASFDFESRVDVNAGNMWIWSRRSMRPDGTRNPTSFELLKSGTVLKTIPPNWRDYVDVVAGRRQRSIPFFIKGSGQELDLFEELSSQRPKIALDTDHQKLINWIQDNTPGGSWWHADHWMLVTHTFALKQAHEALKLKGPYDTLATGTEYGADKNCFCYPLPKGAWTVRRYTRGTAEAKTWEQDGQGYTRCTINQTPTFKLACRLCGGVEKPDGSYVFNEAKQAIDASKMLGAEIKIGEKLLYRTAVLQQHRDKRLIIKIEKDSQKDSAAEMEGYDGSGKAWTRIFDSRIEQTNVTDTFNLDKVIRHLVNESGSDAGWVVKTDGVWNGESLEHIKLLLKGHFGFKPAEAERILGTNVVQPYKLINRPFEVEYPPGRLWNRRGAKLRFEPSQDIDNLKFPTWTKVLTHLGQGLDDVIKNHPWAKANCVNTGADYLLLWVAILFQQPHQRLPYLFFYSDAQDTGKSTFHQALALLMAGEPPIGYMKVSEALKATATFNAELHHTILCAVEELDLNPRRTDAKISYNRIKELVTANFISIHEKRVTPTMTRNWTHWVQCTNDKNACPIFKNDTRITMIRVDTLDPIDMIPPAKLEEMLCKEGPDFTAHVLRMALPPSNDRLLLPALETDDKEAVQTANLSLLEEFIRDRCYTVDGAVILWSEFYEEFVKAIEVTEVEQWSKRYTGARLPDYHPRGRRKSDNQYCVANISWTAKNPDQPILPRLIVRNEKLIPIGGINGQTENQRSNEPTITGRPGTTQDRS